MNKALIIILIVLCLIVVGVVGVSFVSRDSYEFNQVKGLNGDMDLTVRDYTSSFHQFFGLFDKIGDFFERTSNIIGITVAPKDLYIVQFHRTLNNVTEYSYILVFGNQKLGTDQFDNSAFYFSVYAYQDYAGSTRMKDFFQGHNYMWRGYYGMRNNIQFGVGHEDWEIFNASNSIINQLVPKALAKDGNQTWSYTYDYVMKFDTSSWSQYAFTTVVHN